MSVDGEYITNRLFPDFVHEACQKLGIKHESFSEDWVHRLGKVGSHKWVIGYSFDINPTAASGLARDKVATSQALDSAEVPTVMHYLARSRASKNVLAANLTAIPDNQPVVIKPLQGASGHGVRRFDTKADAVEYLQHQPHTDWAMSPWHDVISETRITLLDDDVICAYQKLEPTTHDGLVFYNLGMGARAEVITPPSTLETLARQARTTSGLRLCAVDVIQLRSGEQLILEVNEGIMMEHFARQSDEYRAKAEKVYLKIVKQMFA